MGGEGAGGGGGREPLTISQELWEGRSGEGEARGGEGVRRGMRTLCGQEEEVGGEGEDTIPLQLNASDE